MNYATVIIKVHAGHVEHYLSHTLETAQTLALCQPGETAYIFECGNPAVLEVHHGDIKGQSDRLLFVRAGSPCDEHHLVQG